MNRLTNSVSGCVLLWVYSRESAAESFAGIKLPELIFDTCHTLNFD
jgi:hypothetical protein